MTGGSDSEARCIVPKPSNPVDAVCRCGGTSWMYRHVQPDTPWPWQSRNRVGYRDWPWTNGTLATCTACRRTWFGDRMMTIMARIEPLMVDGAVSIAWIHGIPLHQPQPLVPSDRVDAVRRVSA